MRYVTFLHARDVYVHLHVSRTQYALMSAFLHARDVAFHPYTYQEHNHASLMSAFLHVRVYIPSTRHQEHNMRYVSILTCACVYSIYTSSRTQYDVMSHSYMRVCIFHLARIKNTICVDVSILTCACVYSIYTYQEHTMSVCHILTCACLYSI